MKILPVFSLKFTAVIGSDSFLNHDFSKAIFFSFLAEKTLATVLINFDISDKIYHSISIIIKRLKHLKLPCEDIHNCV